ncbi:hypothetical protein BOX15_Mlig006732g2, partial [Macrostomum lignano]
HKKSQENKNSNKSTSKSSPAYLRVQKDLSDIDTKNHCTRLTYPNPNDLMNFKLAIAPDEGFYKGGLFIFNFHVTDQYPHEAPKVKCETKVYHPNIDLEGNVCLNVLREDWKPVLSINSVIYGLQLLFQEPNPDDPLNREAAEVLKSNRRLFEQNVLRSMRGGYVGEEYFEKCLLK